MNPAIIKRLEHCNNLPSLPAAATRIVELARDPHAGMCDVADAVCKDPALSAKLLKMANSPLYARRRPCETFQQALVLLGLNATLTLALTFTLVTSMKSPLGAGLEYARIWRRSLLAATAARVLGTHLGLKDAEELFLAGLMQDLGMLALDVGYPELYSDLSEQEQDHETLRTLERLHLGVDHADVGSWLLARWNLPQRLVEAVATSHDLEHDPRLQESHRFHQAVALSGRIADVWMAAEPGSPLGEVQQEMAHLEVGEDDVVMSILECVAREATDVEALFEVELLDQCRAEWVLQEAREMMVVRNLQMVQESAALREVAASLREQATVLEEKSRHDNLTGAFNRGHLDVTLLDWFAESQRRGTPLSVIFVDLDDFKKVNDVHGHQVGDEVLGRFSKTLHEVARSADMVARYGGEEFVLLLRDCGTEGARRVCNRLLELCRLRHLDIDGEEPLRVTASMGVATHNERVSFGSSAELVRAADEALYKAKQTGKNRFVEHEVRADAA